MSSATDPFFENLSRKKKYFQLRNEVNQVARSWFDQNNFLEVETPILSPYSSLEKYIYPLTTQVVDDRNISHKNFLRVSPELALKKLMASGYERIFEIGKCFRNKESADSSQHLFEFNLLEWYVKGLNLDGLIDQFISFIEFLFLQIFGSLDFSFGGKESHLYWKKVSVKSVFKQYADVDFDQMKNWEELIPIALKKINNKGFPQPGSFNLDDAFYWIFLNEIESLLTEPIILFHYPDFQASFSKVFRDSTGKSYGLRFEAYLGGLELANAFEELCDSDEQERRWQENRRWFLESSCESYLESFPMDPLFLKALSCLSQSNFSEVEKVGGEMIVNVNSTVLSGIAVGWDRLLMLLGDETDIRNLSMSETSRR